MIQNKIDEPVLEQLVNANFAKLEILPKHQETLWGLLRLIREKDSGKEDSTYDHSLRVALLSADMADLLGFKSKPLFYAGLLHDLGKVTIEDSVLKKNEGFSGSDLDKIKAHVVNGYRQLNGNYEFSGSILLWHHYFKPNDPYPTLDEITPLQAHLPEESRRRAKKYGLILAIADCYDAMVSRDNNMYGGRISPADSKVRMLALYPKNRTLINRLYERGVLGKPYEELWADRMNALEQEAPKPSQDAAAATRYTA